MKTATYRMELISSIYLENNSCGRYGDRRALNELSKLSADQWSVFRCKEILDIKDESYLFVCSFFVCLFVLLLLGQLKVKKQGKGIGNRILFLPSTVLTLGRGV